MLIPLFSIAFLSSSLICKKDKIAFNFLWLFMVIIIMNTYNNADWDAYEFMYSLITSFDKCSVTDFGYGFFNLLGNSYLHLSFFWFRAIFTFCGMILLRKIISNYSPYPALVLALYFIAPFFPNDIIQIRNFMAQTLLCLFLSIWIESDFKLKYLCMGLILSIMMHSSITYFIVIFILYFIKDEKKLYIFAGIASLMVGILPILLKKIPFIPIEKITYYLNAVNQKIDFRGIVIIIAFLAGLYILYKIRNYAECCSNLRFYKWADTVYKLNILCIPACAVMTMWTFNFYRVPRNMLLLNYIVYSMYLAEKKDKRIINYTTLVLIIIGLIWSALNSFSQWSVIWNNNAIFIL